MIRSALRTACVVLSLSSALACQKGAAEQPPKPATAVVPADAKSVAAFRDANPQTGSHAKVHGYVGSVNGKAWPVVDKVGETMPFVFCDMAAPPANVQKGAHVVLEGKVEDPGMIKECTMTVL
jgi:hypothetical protein